MLLWSVIYPRLDKKHNMMFTLLVVHGIYNLKSMLKQAFLDLFISSFLQVVLALQVHIGRKNTNELLAQSKIY